MAAEMQESEGETVMKETTEEKKLDVESQIEEAMRARVNHFREQADSLTFEGVRRLLEKDLGMEKLALDVHKRFVKQRLLECLNGAAAADGSKDSGEMGGKLVQSKRESESPEGLESEKYTKEPCSEDEEKMEDSPVMGLLAGKKTTTPDTEVQAKKNKEVPSEGNIKKALWKRASYIKDNSEKMTMAGLRRLLEEDLKLDKFSLDPFKKFISNQLDEVLKSGEVSERDESDEEEVPKKRNLKKVLHEKTSKTVSIEESLGSLDKESDEEDEVPKKKNLKKVLHEKTSKKVSSEESLDSLDKESDEEEDVKPKRKISAKQNITKSEGSRKRKTAEKETKASGNKRIKSSETVAEDRSDAEDNGNTSEDSNPQSPAEKPAKKGEALTPVYGKRVEHLKSVIKSCGMSVPPVIYKKIKQVPEIKRETQLIKELEEILSREGLSANPSEKEIKQVRRSKERAKELEGIDTSNIVSSSRRRSTSNYWPPPKPKVPVESEDSDSEEDDNDEDDEDEDNDGSQSEEDEEGPEEDDSD